MISLRCALLLAAFALASVAQAGSELLGTVEMTVDGDKQTWYVLQPEGDFTPTTLWLTLKPGRNALSMAAYESPDVDFVRDEPSGSPVPDADAAVILFLISFPEGASELGYTLPAEPRTGPVSIRWLANWSDPLNGWDIGEGQGEIRLTTIDANRGASHFAGSFHGVLQREPGDTKTVKSGRFDVKQVPYYERPQR